MDNRILFTLFFSVILLTATSIPGFLSSAYAENGKVTICHVPPGNPDNAHTISVSSSALDAHLNHGDYAGECSSNNQDQSENEQTENNPSTPVIIPSKNKITVCHNPSGNPKNAETMTIFSYRLATHLEHRDSYGACLTNETEQPTTQQYSYNTQTSVYPKRVTICHNNQYSDNIPENEIESHLEHGDHLGACTLEDFVFGNPLTYTPVRNTPTHC